MMAEDEKDTGLTPTDGGQEPQTPQQDSAGTQGQEPERFDADYVKRLRSEAADYRKKLRELEQVVKQHETEKLSETEKLQQRLAELEREQATYQTERQERTVRYEVLLAANKLGVIDPDAAYKLLDTAAIEFDEDGRPKNIEQALRALITARPYLAGQSNANPTNPPRARDEEDAFTKALYRGAGITRS